MKNHINQHKYQEQYELEKRLAERLRNAPKSGRGALYGAVYDEFFRFAATHSGVTHQDEGEEAPRRALQKWRLVGRYAQADTELLEIGAGNYAFAELAAERVKKVRALEVSASSTYHNEGAPKKVTVLISPTGVIPLPDKSVDVVYTNQVMEHLHEEDADDQLKDIFRVLKPSGVYVCFTPNRLSGPHDVSKYFDRTASGLHIHEYMIDELVRIFRHAGFSKIRVYAGGKGFYVRLPRWIFAMTEVVLTALPWTLGAPLARWYPIRALLGIAAVGIK